MINRCAWSQSITSSFRIKLSSSMKAAEAPACSKLPASSKAMPRDKMQAGSRQDATWGALTKPTASPKSQIEPWCSIPFRCLKRNKWEFAMSGPFQRLNNKCATFPLERNPFEKHEQQVWKVGQNKPQMLKTMYWHRSAPSARCGKSSSHGCLKAPTMLEFASGGSIFFKAVERDVGLFFKGCLRDLYLC